MSVPLTIANLRDVTLAELLALATLGAALIEADVEQWGGFPAAAARARSVLESMGLEPPLK